MDIGDKLVRTDVHTAAAIHIVKKILEAALSARQTIGAKPAPNPATSTSVCQLYMFTPVIKQQDPPVKVVVRVIGEVNALVVLSTVLQIFVISHQGDVFPVLTDTGAISAMRLALDLIVNDAERRTENVWSVFQIFGETHAKMPVISFTA